MAHISLNSYASKIFENHPLAVWGLDDNLHYLSVIDAAQRDFTLWLANNCTSVAPTGYPLGLSHEFEVTGQLEILPGATACDVTLLGEATWGQYTGDTWDDLMPTGSYSFTNWSHVLTNAPAITLLTSPDRKSLCVSFFVSSNVTYIESVNIRLSYINTLTNIAESQTVSVPLMVHDDSWQKVLGTFNSEYMGDGFIINVQAVYSQASDGAEVLWLGGFNVGHWSEVFCHQFNGVDPIARPEEISSVIGTGLCATVNSIMDSNDSGWAIVDNGKLLCMHDGLPLVYGSINQTCLYPGAGGLPSLVLPAKGFMTNTGHHNDATYEFWMRIDPTAQTATRIFGPLQGTDGLYVERGYLKLQIGKKYAWHYVGKWYRPMLISIRYSPSKASLLINGEQVISLTLEDSDTASMAAEDFVGFYCTSETFPFEIDCVAIYPYYQSAEIAKKNFVYGQGVQKTNIIDQQHKGETVMFDFPFSKYTVDFKIPETSRWDTGYFTNVFVNGRAISVPSYSLPEVKLKLTTGGDATTLETDWNATIASSVPASAPYIRFNDLPAGEYGYLYYSSFNQLNETVKTFFVQARPTGDGPVFVIRDKVTGSYLRYDVVGSTVEVKYSNYGDAESLLYSEAIELNELKKIGIEIDAFVKFYATRLHGFFNTRQSLELFVGGYGGESFVGDIYGVDFNGDFYSEPGFVNGFIYGDIPTGMSNNQLCFVLENGEILLDLNLSGYWRTSVPMSHFAKYVTGSGGEKFYDLDMLQLNADVVRPPVAGRAGADIKTYVTFQTNDVGIKSINDFASTDYIDRVMNIDDQAWETTKFGFVDGAVVYPPRSESIHNMMVGLHVRFDVPRARQKSALVKQIEVASIAVDSDKFHLIGTKYGQDVWPFGRSGNAYLPKPYNPFVITKDSAPYLYLTKDSGIQILQESVDYERGIYIPINQSAAPDFKLGAIRMWLRYEDESFPATPRKIFEINSKDRVCHGYLIRDYDTDRARLYLLDTLTDEECANIKYIQEDIDVYRSVLTSERWTSVSIMFGDSISLDRQEGSLILMPGVTFQNIGIYENSNEAIFAMLTNNKWQDIVSEFATWQEVIDSGVWDIILNEMSMASYFVDTVPIYRSLIGTESIQIEDNHGQSTVVQSSVKLYSDVEFRTFVLRQAEPYSVR